MNISKVKAAVAVEGKPSPASPQKPIKKFSTTMSKLSKTTDTFFDTEHKVKLHSGI
jgi:hypothetical protein